MRIEKSVLENAIDIVSRAVSSRGVKPSLNGILFEANGKLNLYATDLETAIKHVNDIESEEESNFIIDAKLISKVVKSLPEGEIEINYNGNTVEIKANKSRFSLNTIRGDEFPDFHPASDTGFKVVLNADTVKEMIDKVIFCAATDEYMRNLNGVFWEFNGSNLRLVASDGFRIGYIDKEIENDNDFSFFLSLRSMREIQKLLDSHDGYFKLIFDGSKVGFELDDTQVVVRVMDTEFPEYTRVIPNEFQTRIIVNRNTLLDALKRVSIVGEGVKITISDEMSIETKESDYGEAREKLGISKEGSDQEIAFNPEYLIKSLSSIPTDEAEIKFIDDSKPAMIKPIEQEYPTYVIMPMRM